MNKGLLGPEWFGCCNTGRRPALFHSINGKWVIGPELSCREVLERRLHYSTKRKHDCVTVLKTRSVAIKVFKGLCKEVETWNEEQKANYQRERIKAREGDLAAVLNLGVL